MADQENLDEELKAKLQADFKEFMANQSKSFPSVIWNVEETTKCLKDQGVFTDQDRSHVLEHSLQEQRKDALVKILASKNVDEVNRIIAAMENAKNEKIAMSLRTFKTRFNRKHEADVDDFMLSLYSKFASDSASGRATTRALPDSEEIESLSLPGKPIIGTDPSTTKLCRRSEIPIDPVPAPKRKKASSSDLDEYFLLDFVATSTDLEEIKAELESTDTLDKMVWGSKRNATNKTTLLACFDRTDKKPECLQLLLESFENRLKNTPVGQTGGWSMKKYLDQQDSLEKKTAAHLAAENGMEQALEELRTGGCDLFLKDKNDTTAMQLMYLNVPNAVTKILDGAVTLKPAEEKKKFDVHCDFSAVIGRPLTKGTVEASSSDPTTQRDSAAVEIEMNDIPPTSQIDETPATAQLLEKPKCESDSEFPFEETWHLQNLISQQQDVEATKKWLVHPTVKLFLELKWKQMWIWFYLSAFVQIFMYAVHNYFVIQVFLYECQYPTNSTTTTDNNSNSTSSNEINVDSEHEADGCKINNMWLIRLSTFLLSYNVLFALKELFEMLLKVYKGKTKFGGLMNYLTTFETPLQICSLFCIIWVASLSRVTTDWDYSFAAAGVIVSWILILNQWGILYDGIGIYVQILITVMKTFFKLMRIYVLLIVGFSVAFCIMFPQEEPFRNLLLSMAKILIMMSGEFEYDDLFYGDNGGPPIKWMSHLIFTFFAFLMTFILLNLLVGLVVNDVKEVTDISEVTLLTIKVDQLFVMESSIICLCDCIFNCWQKGSKKYPNIFVTPIGGDPVTITEKMKMKEIPQKLQEKVRP